MDEEIKRLALRISGLPRGNGRRYATSLRQQIRRVATLLRKRGSSWREVADQIGIPVETIRGFCAARVPARRGFVAVEVAEPVQDAAMTLACPGGYRVEGLTMETVAELLGRLR